MPARKKDSSTRARANKASTRATLRRAAADESAAEAYAQMTVAQLRAAVDVINETRPADQRLSKQGNKATLVEMLAAASRNIPDLPEHPPRVTEDGERIEVRWHDQTRSWWNDVWTSPMAAEWDDSDVHNVLVVALLYDDIWSASTPKDRKDALSEYRLQRSDLGLSPYSRRRLEWTIETAEDAKDRGDRRRAATGGPAAPTSSRQRDRAIDPRAVLSVVS